jgi:hypothetical protein
MNPMIRFARRLEDRLPRFGDTRNILFNARTAMNYAIVRPICEAMSRDPRVRFYFTASEKNVGEVYRDLSTPGPAITPSRATLMKFDAYVAADLLWLRLFRATRRIQMFHGVAGKYASAYHGQSVREWHRVFFVNKRRLRNYVEAGALDPGSDNARLVGYPKIDCLANGSIKRDDILKSLGLDPAKPSVLYAPTWSPYSSLNAMGEEIVRMLCSMGWSVIVKLHDRSQCPEYIHSGGTDWRARLEPLLKRSDGVLANGCDATPYLAAADVLITDHSSVGFEYLLLDRPVIRVEMPQLIERTGIPREYVSLLAEASHSVKTVDETRKAVEGAFGDPGWKSRSRRWVAGELFYKPGTATARAVKDLYEVIELDQPAVN